MNAPQWWIDAADIDGEDRRRWLCVRLGWYRFVVPDIIEHYAGAVVVTF